MMNEERMPMHMPHLSLPITDQGHGFTRSTGFTVQEHMSMARMSTMRLSELQYAGKVSRFLVLVDNPIVDVVISSRMIVLAARVALARHVAVAAEVVSSTAPADHLR